MATYRANYSTVLTRILSLAPTANLYLLGYYNPFPADPTSPAAPVFDAGGVALNGIIPDLAGAFGAAYVDNATPFMGHEAAYYYQAAQPAGSSVPDPFGGLLPIGNVHPNGTGYDVIAADVATAPVPEPAAWGVLVAGVASMSWLRRRT